MHVPSRLIPPLFVVLWATGFIGARYAMPWAEPFTFLAARFAIAFVLIALIARLMGARASTPRQALHSAIAGTLMHGVYLGGVFWAIDNGMPAGLSALIVGLQPLITAVMAGAFLKERILPRHWAGLAAGFAGVAMVLWPKLGAVSGVSGAALAAAVISVFGMSAGTVWQKRFGGGDLISGTMWQYLGGGTVTAAAALALETGAFTLSGELVFAMVWLVLVLSIGAIFLLMVMIREGAMAGVASLFYLVPAVTAVIAYVLFGETLTLFQLAGMALVTLGVGLATARQQAPAIS
ncbi:MAG TPA: DMT family transporter [Rhizobiales bacterium]|nr:DMT family transporter [Hyphomicrobiales bacterium]